MGKTTVTFSTEFSTEQNEEQSTETFVKLRNYAKFKLLIINC